MAIQKFVFLDPTTGQYKEQTGADSIVVPAGVGASDAVNKGQLDSVESALQLALTTEVARASAAESTEATARAEADTALDLALDAEVARASGVEAALNTAIGTESNRALMAEIGLSNALDAEATRAVAAEQALGVRIDDEEAARASAITTEANARIAADSAEATARANAVTAEAEARSAGDVSLTNALAAEAIARAAAVQAEKDRAEAAELALTTALNVEITARVNAVAAEASARAVAVLAEHDRALAAEAVLTSDLAAEVTARGVAVTAEADARIAADSALDVRLDTLEGDDTVVGSVRYLIDLLSDSSSSALTTERDARIAADAALQQEIDAEETARAQAISDVSQSLVIEGNRATQAEQALGMRLDTVEGQGFGSISYAVSQEQNRAQSIENTLDMAIQSVNAALQQEVMTDRNVAINNAIMMESQARASADTSVLDAARAYADGIAQGLKFKESVRFASSTTAAAWTGQGMQTFQLPGQFAEYVAAASLSDVTPGDRVLITGGPDMWSGSTDAGIYVVNGAGGLTRSSDCANGADASGAYVFVEQGVFAFDAMNWQEGSPAGPIYNSPPGVSFVCAAIKGSDIVGSHSIRFAVFSRMEQLSFGNGIQKQGNYVSTKIKSIGGLAGGWDGLELLNADPSHIAIGPQGIALTGSLVGGANADDQHKHSQVTTAVYSGSVSPAFTTGAGMVATWDSPDCAGYLLSGNGMEATMLLMGKLAFQVMGFAAGEVIYLGSDGSLGTLCHFSDIPSGKYAIPVGRAIQGGLSLQVGTSLLKA